MAKYTITYTTDHPTSLDDEFSLIEIYAHNQKEVDLIIHNVERMFDGVTVQCEEDVPKAKPRKRVNSDKRKKV